MSAPLYLLDTNIISHMMINGAGMAARQAESVIAANPQLQMCTSVVVQAELAFGLAKRPSTRLQKAMELQLANILVLPLDGEVVPHYARLRAELETNGTPIGPNDALIAAHALALDAILVSADTEFKRIPGLKLENWLELPQL
ncbi:MAG: PIN domain-containing protein [Pseudomonadota bacterium]